MNHLIAPFLLLLFVGCSFFPPEDYQNEDAKLRERAMKLHREAIVVDTHNDITSPMTDEGFDLGALDKSGKTQTDIPRMKEGGLDAEFFAIYVAAKYAKEGGSARRAMDMINDVYEQTRRHP
jgi:membrane dipeptidase